MRTPTIIPLLLLAFTMNAQVQVDKPVVLTGAQPADRRVEGIPAPTSDDQAMNAEGLQLAAYAYAEITGQPDLWSVQVQPVPDSLPAGSLLLLKAAFTNTGPVELSINGGPLAPVTKNGVAPLDSADVLAGEVVVLVHDGQRFQLTGPASRAPRNCPPGTVTVNGQYCMELQKRALSDFDLAALACGMAGGRMCTWGEWHYACRNATALGLTDIVGDWEWTNNTANGDGLVRIVGGSSCWGHNTSPAWDVQPRNYRCCFDR